MAERLDAAAFAKLSDDGITVALLADLDFAKKRLLLSSTPFNLHYYHEGKNKTPTTYTGVGAFGQVSAIKETNDIQANGVQLSLSGIPTELIKTALEENYQGRSARLFFALLDENNEIIDKPFQIFSGRMDTMVVSIGKEAQIELKIESLLVDWQRPRVRRYTHEDQKTIDRTDKGLIFVSKIPDREIVWGRA